MNTDNKDNIVKLFIGAAKSHHRAFENKVSEFGVHRSQHRILMFLSKREGVCTYQKDIADAFDISAAAVAVSVKKLEEDGFIKRLSDERDCRTNIIVLTEKGQDIVSATTNIITSLDSAMFDGFSDPEISEFSRYLSRLCDNIRSFDRQ